MRAQTSVRIGRSVSRYGLTPLPFGHYASTYASAASVSGSQNIMSIARYSSVAVDSGERLEGLDQTRVEPSPPLQQETAVGRLMRDRHGILLDIVIRFSLSWP